MFFKRKKKSNKEIIRSIDKRITEIRKILGAGHPENEEALYKELELLIGMRHR